MQRRLGRGDILISLTDIKIKARDEQFPKELYLSDGPAVLAESKSPLRAAKREAIAERLYIAALRGSLTRYGTRCQSQRD